MKGRKSGLFHFYAANFNIELLFLLYEVENLYPNLFYHRS
jgi:hypothetical protein